MLALQGLPSNTFSKVLKQLQQNDKNNLRLASTCLNERVTKIDLSPRIWSFIITDQNHAQITEGLSESIVKLKSDLQNPEIQLEFNLSSKTLVKLDDADRKCIVQNLIKQFRKYITKLVLRLHGDEYFLKEADFFCPNLSILSVNSPVKERGSFTVHKKESCLILEDLLQTYGGTVSVLEVYGYWDFNTRKEYNITSLKTLKIKNAMIMQVRSMFQICGHCITSAELCSIEGDEVSGLDVLLPNMRHLHICNADNFAMFIVPAKNASNLESLSFSTDNYDFDETFISYMNNFPAFPKLKLVEVNNPKLLKAILRTCSNTLEYLYVPKQDRTTSWEKVCVSRKLPVLKELCVEGLKKWSVNMIKKNSATLECLVIYGFVSLEDFEEKENREFEEARTLSAQVGFNIGFKSEEYCWSYFTMLKLTFPKLKLLLLPDCTNAAIVNRLTASCPEGMKIITDRFEAGQALKARIMKDYPCPRYARLLHKDIFNYFELKKEDCEVKRIDAELEAKN